MPLLGRLLFSATAGVALIILAGCGGGNASPSSTRPATAPAGFLELAAKIDRALVVGDVDLAELTSFKPYACPSNIFPAPGPNCAEAAAGGGVYAVGIGTYNSEGTVYDPPSYGRYLAGWIYDALRDSSDEFGSGAPRVYATARMSREVELSRGESETYEAIATRIGRSPLDGRPIREALVFHTAETAGGWRITGLLKGPAAFLDPESQEAASMFTSWERWSRPTPPGEPIGRWKAGRAGREVAYLDSSGTLFVASADGGSTKTVARGVCGGATSGKNELTWSADIQLIAVRCAGSAQGRSNLEIYRSDGSGAQGVIENIASYAWSPNGQRIAYQTLDAPGGVLTASVRLRDPDTGADSLVLDDAILLDWPRPDELLLGLSPTSQSGAYFETYEANFYNLATGASARVPRFDDQRQFWLAPPATKAIVLDGPAGRKDAPGTQLAVYDIASGAETILTGWAISYGSESIPHQNIVVSPGDSDGFIWADYGVQGLAILQGAPDGSHATLLDRLGGEIRSISADGLVLYSPGPGGPPGLTIRDLLSGAETNWPEATTGAIAPWGGVS